MSWRNCLAVVRVGGQFYDRHLHLSILYFAKLETQCINQSFVRHLYQQYTSPSKKSANHLSATNITKGRWTGKEDENLLRIIEECKKYDPIKKVTNYPWQEISAKMERRSTAQVRNRYVNYLSCTNKKKGRWTGKEDEDLSRITEECKIYDPIKKVTNYPWAEISAKMERRSAQQCYHRYKYHTSLTNSNKGRWTGKDDENLLCIIEECKTYDPIKKVTKYPWAEISAKMESRSPVQVRNRYVNILSCTTNMKGRWTGKEDEDLLRFMDECKLYDSIRKVTHYPWAEISAKMERRSALQCHHRYKYNIPCPNINKGQWTGNEDLNLLRIIGECNTYDPIKKVTNYPWEEISTKMENRSAKQCYHRYKYITSCPNINKGRWTGKEDEKLLHIIEECKIYDPTRKVTNYPWVEISAKMESRTAKQCTNRYINYLSNTNINKGRWTGKEDEKLLCIIEELKIFDPIRKVTNYPWMKISAKMESRSAMQCSNRYIKYLSCTNMNKGPWTEKENEKLFHIIEECKTYDPIKKITKYPWEKISARMKSRSSSQCWGRYRRLLS